MPDYWKRYVGLSAIAAGAYVACPDGSWLQTGTFVGIGLAAAAAILVGIRIHRPAAAAPWRLFALGIALNALGSLVDSLLWNLRGQGFPSVADAFYLGLYPALVAGLVLLVRRRNSGGDWTAAVDATTIAIGLGLLAWVFVVRSAVDDSGLSFVGRALNIAYPVGDVLLLAMFVRLVVDATRTEPVLRLVAGSLALFLADDTAWAVCNRIGWEPGPVSGRLLGATALAAYVSLGAAGLHRSMRGAGEPSSGRRLRRSPVLIGLLTATSLVAPAILLGEVLQHRIADGVAVALGSAALFALVVSRMAQLLREVERQTRQLRALARFDELTGVSSRRSWVAELWHRLEEARRERAPLTVVMLELDGFREFVGRQGEQAGDRLLLEAAAAWADGLRTADELGRHSGWQFTVTLPGADADEGHAVVRRLRAATPHAWTFAAGVATWDAIETADELVARVEAALHEAKRAGWNRIAEATGARPVGSADLSSPFA